MKSKNLIRQGVIRLTYSALLSAVCVILAFAAKGIFGESPLRLTIENLPVFMASFFFGPVWGMAVAICADLLSCVMFGMAPYPLITVGAALIGAVSGIFYNYVLKKAPMGVRVVLSVLFAHMVGSMTVKTLALVPFFGDTAITLFLRIPVYVGITVIESLILVFLTKSKAFMRQIDIIKGKK